MRLQELANSSEKRATEIVLGPRGCEDAETGLAHSLGSVQFSPTTLKARASPHLQHPETNPCYTLDWPFLSSFSHFFLFLGGIFLTTRTMGNKPF